MLSDCHRIHQRSASFSLPPAEHRAMSRGPATSTSPTNAHSYLPDAGSRKRASSTSLAFRKRVAQSHGAPPLPMRPRRRRVIHDGRSKRRVYLHHEDLDAAGFSSCSPSKDSSKGSMDHQQSSNGHCSTRLEADNSDHSSGARAQSAYITIPLTGDIVDDSICDEFSASAHGHLSSLAYTSPKKVSTDHKFQIPMGGESRSTSTAPLGEISSSHRARHEETSTSSPPGDPGPIYIQ
eukprot:Blabericola_migrator_1__6690@NODE_3383_length_1818_cov_40_848087_g2107_i0_p1_GENE_NODE_3383_length_1818_cov_40_848087_g2107_i0NODE_3383_length_1818_cov_40_848087_g2107_i0_p1_ORF_typecomplete_len236_score22_91_NODE_3383_length_1818_cov_40_848087_g2107_i0275982